MADARVTMNLAEARRNLKAARARLTEFTATIDAKHGPDWESRYLAQGVVDLAAHANGEAQS